MKGEKIILVIHLYCFYADRVTSNKYKYDINRKIRYYLNKYRNISVETDITYSKSTLFKCVSIEDYVQ